MTKSEVENVQDVISNIVTEGETTKGDDQSISSRFSQFFTDFKKSMENRNYAFEVFEKNFIFLKGFVFFYIIIFAIVNVFTYKDLGLIKTKPKYFFIESIIFAMSTVIPFLLTCYLRNDKRYNGEQIISISIAMFIVFFALNYVLEMSGFYSAIFEHDIPAEKLKEKELADKMENESMSQYDKLKANLSLTTEIILALMFMSALFLLFYSALFVKDTDPSYTQFTSIPPIVVFIIETILFGVICAVPIFVMAYNRSALSISTYKEFLLITAKFVILHILLQVSGFYRYIFEGNNRYKN